MRPEAFHQALGWTRMPRRVSEQRDVAERDHHQVRLRLRARLVGLHPPRPRPEAWREAARVGGPDHAAQGRHGYYDRFRNRLMIPIHSETGALVGFGGRSLDGSEPKYLNSPESELFNKSRLLYNLHRSEGRDAPHRPGHPRRRLLRRDRHRSRRRSGRGRLDGHLPHAGQASLLRRFTRRVVIAYDGDDAGRNATLRAAPVLLSAGLHVEALDLQGEKDPDSLVQKRGVGRFLEVLCQRHRHLRVRPAGVGSGAAQLTGREKSERVEQFMPLLSAVTDPVVRNERRAAHRGRVPAGVRDGLVARARQSRAATSERQASAPPRPRREIRADGAFRGGCRRSRSARLREELFEDPACKTLFSIIKNDLAAGQPIDFAQVATHLRGEAELTLLSGAQPERRA